VFNPLIYPHFSQKCFPFCCELPILSLRFEISSRRSSRQLPITVEKSCQLGSAWSSNVASIDSHITQQYRISRKYPARGNQFNGAIHYVISNCTIKNIIFILSSSLSLSLSLSLFLCLFLSPFVSSCLTKGIEITRFRLIDNSARQ